MPVGECPAVGYSVSVPARARARFSETAFDLRRTTVLQQLGRYDPTARRGDDVFAKTYRTSTGAVARHTVRRAGDAVDIGVEVDHGNADDELEHWRRVFPIADGAAEFAPRAPSLARLHGAMPGLRIIRVPWLFDVALGAVLQQRVTFADAARSFSRLVETFGTSSSLGAAAPSAKRIARLNWNELRRLGIDAKRARTIVELAREHVRTGFLASATPLPALRDRFASIRGIGPWTTAMFLGFGAGDTDAVPVGDVHLPSLITRLLASEPRGTDARMLELLEPHRGQRFRVIRLAMSAKSARALPD